MRPLFRLDDLVVTDATLDLDVPQRCRLAVDRAGKTWLVEDLRAEHLEDDVAWQLFLADAVLRIDGGTRVGTVAGAPVARPARLTAPGLPLSVQRGTGTQIAPSHDRRSGWSPTGSGATAGRHAPSACRIAVQSATKASATSWSAALDDPES